MNLTTRPHDGQIAISFNKTEQDTLQQTAVLAQDLLHQLHQMENDGQTNPEQVEHQLSLWRERLSKMNSERERAP